MGYIEEKIKEILAENLENKIPAEQINADNDLKDLGINSISFIKIIVGLETEFDIEFDDEDLDASKFATIKDLIEYVGNKVT